MARPSRQKQFAMMQEKLIRELDPENEAPPPSDSESVDSDVEEAQTKAATDHYVSVGKSKLRGKNTSAASLGPQYRGAKVSRADLEADDDDDEDGDEDNFEDAQEELSPGKAGGNGSDSASDSDDDVFDDPETADLEADHDDRDVEIDSDDAFGESDEEKFKDYTFRGSSKVLPGVKGKRVARPTAADFLGSDDEDEEEGFGEGGEDELDSEEDDDPEDGEEGSDDEMVDEERRNLIDDEAEESDEEEEEDDDMDGFIVNSDEDDEEDDDDDGDEDDDDQDEDEDEDDEDDEDGNVRKPRQDTIMDRKSLADLVSAGSKSVAVSLSEGQQKDIAKGIAIRQQRKAFDALLNVRIRLQKSLVAINTLSLAEGDPEDQSSEPYEAAEAAALKLWNAIDSFRSNLPSSSSSSTKAGQKRKREDATPETTSQQMWQTLEAAEQRAAPRRRAVLQNWSQKANNIRTVDRTASSARKFAAGAADKPLTARLDEEMENPERLIKRTRTPRSCAPAQVARKLNEDAGIYDDADFYQLLLKELVDQRTADTSAGAGAVGAAATIRFAAVKEAKAKKHVDTKASKGRKMRFNVHDKLQNFMAPEDRRSWEQSAIDRLFGTLFGQKMVLNEDDEDRVSDDEDEEMGGAGVGGAEEAGLRLFRS